MTCCVPVAPSVSAQAAVRLSQSATEPQMPSSSQQQQPRHVAASVSTTRHPHATGPQVTAATRAQLMPFILGVRVSYVVSGGKCNRYSHALVLKYLCRNHTITHRTIIDNFCFTNQLKSRLFIQ